MPDPLFRAWPTFLVRAPLSRDDARPPADDSHLAVLRAAMNDRRLVEAITLASPSLTNVFRLVAADRVAEIRPRQLRRAALAVLRYDIRMRTRPTPFGLFAGVAVGEFDAVGKLEVGHAHRHRTHVDMSWLSRIVHRLERDPEVLCGLRVRAHQALVRRGDRIVLDVPSTLGAGPGQTARTVVSVRHSAVVAVALAASATPVLFTVLAKDLAERFSGGAVEPVARLLGALVEQDLLITDLRPPLDGTDPLTHVIDRLPDGRHRSRLAEVDLLRRSFDHLGHGQGTDRLTELVARAREIEDFETPLHVDTLLDLRMRLSHEVRTEVERTAEVLWRMSPSRLGMRPLRGYHGRFVERYGTDRLVPVLDLLDATRSLGPPAGYEWPMSEAVADPAAEPASPEREQAIGRLLSRALRDGAHEIVLTDDLVAQIVHDQADPADMPNSCELYLHVVDLADGDFRVVMSPSPGSHQAGATRGRFTDLLPEQAAPSQGVHVAGAVLVDLAFTPRSGKAANLAHIPSVSGRRISVGLPDAPGVEEIPLSEIAVGGTLERLYAVHLPTNRELVPILPSMVSPAVQAPNAIRLLWEIGMEGQRLWEPWNWGSMAYSPFLPRVRYGRSVLAPATWRLEELRDRLDGEWPEEVSRWREYWSVPDQVLVVSTDQRLLLDLNEPWHVELLRDELRRDPALVAQESAGGAERVGDGHLREIVVSLAPRGEHGRPPHVAHVVTRPEPPKLADDWLYLLIRGARQIQDDVLRDHMPELVHRATGLGVDRWFFIRYTDTDGHHLRVRLHGDPARLWSEVLPSVGGLLARWQHAGLVGAHRLDQYEPELERYGGADARVAAERLFHADSHAALELLRLAKGPSEFSLETLAAVSVAALAYAFGDPMPDAPWVTAKDDPAVAWLSITGSRRDLPAAYRTEAARWQRRIDPAGGWPGMDSAVLTALSERDARAAEYGALIRQLIASGRCRAPQARVVGSLMHMTCNRLFGGAADMENTVLGIARGAVQDNANRRRNKR